MRKTFPCYRRNCRSRVSSFSLSNTLLFVGFISMLGCQEPRREIEVEWPPSSAENKPWTRWWWMGSAVDSANITAELEQMSEAGFGGVEITPIYGVKGQEAQNIPYLSPQWMDMLAHTTAEAERLGMRVDMNHGTGWPFGGPQIEPKHAASRLHIETWTVEDGKHFSRTLRSSTELSDTLVYERKLIILTAYSGAGAVLNLLDSVDAEQRIDWEPPSGTWTIYAGYLGKTGQKVKRAAPGGEGLTVDHLSFDAVARYLKRFEPVLADTAPAVRALFNDSYEVYRANWTPGLLQAFRQRRGYALQLHIEALLSREDTERNRRVKCDYRETVHELLLESFTLQWRDWANDRGMMVRNQAHGSPGNLLDLYGAVDIPECETFGISKFPIPGLRREPGFIRTQEDPDPVMLQFASSAAHTRGKPLVSSESFTWLAEHFRTSLSQCKPELDQLFLSGVNHVFFHGTTYSPREAAWPGWLFYASVHFGPTNTFWRDIPAFNRYIARCQSLLQEGRPDRDILLYWPVYDIWSDATYPRLDYQITIHNLHDWLLESDFYHVSNQLKAGGWQVDFVSDAIAQEATVVNGEIQLGGVGYKTMVIPRLEYMPLATLKKILSLADEGATVVFRDMDMDVPGLHDHGRRSNLQRALLDGLEFRETDSGAHAVAHTGEGRVLHVEDMPSAMQHLNIVSETVQEANLRFLRRRHVDGYIYFLVNHADKPVRGTVDLKAKAHALVAMDPLTGNIGKARFQQDRDGISVRIALEPGQSVFLKTFENTRIRNAPRHMVDRQAPVPLTGTWQVTPVSGGPVNPPAYTTDTLDTWTAHRPQWERFAGTVRYTISFTKPQGQYSGLLLDLGTVRESARVHVNGREAAVLWSLPFTADIGEYVQEGENLLEIEVTNLMANRIRDMEIRGVEWKIFENINIVNVDYEPFDASEWAPMESGLLGPVRLIPLKRVEQ